jgi:hypothetical protein
MSSTAGSKVFPTNINIAATRLGIHDLPDFAGLTSRERHIFQRFIRNVCTKNPSDSFRVSVANLADAVVVSTRTIQRAIKGLVDKGWVTRTQVQKRSGMEIADTKLTHKALKVLGFLDPKPQKAGFSRATSTAHVYSDSIDSFNTKRQSSPSTEVTSQIDDEKPSETEVKVKPVTIPSDLSFLMRMGLKPSGIFKLMKIASKAGQHLGTIVNAVKDALKDAKNVYAYIYDLIQRPRDWAKEAQPTPKQPVFQKDTRETYEQRQAEAQRQRTLALRKQHQEATERLLAIFKQHKMLVNEAGTKIWVEMGGCIHYFSIQDLHKKVLDRRYVSDNNRHATLIEAFEDGRLMPFDPNNPPAPRESTSSFATAHPASASPAPKVKQPDRQSGFQPIGRLFPALIDDVPF